MAGNPRDQYCIVGVGETEYSRASGRTTRAMGAEAIRNAMNDAGLTPDQVDGMLSYHGGDSTPSTSIQYDLGIRPNFYMDCSGGGSSTEALVGLAIGAIEAGMCDVVAIFRSMNGYSSVRIGGTGARAAAPIGGLDLLKRPYGLISAVQQFSYTFTPPHGRVRRQERGFGRHQSRPLQPRLQQPKALMKHRVTVDDVMNSRWIIRPVAHLLDCCLETDNATCVIVTSAARAKDLKHKPIYVKGVQGRGTKPGGDFHYQHGPITRVAGHYVGPRVFDLAGVKHEDVDPHRLLRRLYLHRAAPVRGLRLVRKRRGQGLRNRRHHQPGRQAAQQRQRRPPLRGLYPRHEHGHRKRAPAARHR